MSRPCPPRPPGNDITLRVVSARTEPLALGGAGVTAGDAVTTYKWMINEDNTGTTTTRNANPGSGCSAWADSAKTSPNAAYPDSCKWTSIAGLASSAPVVAQGDRDHPQRSRQPERPSRRPLPHLGAGRRLQARRHAVHDPGRPAAWSTVPLQPLPLPTATIKAQVFADVTEANGQFDPGEDGISGFAGKITDYLGQVNTDVFGNPLCTTYKFNDANNDGVQDPGEAIILDADQTPIVTHLGGKCLSGDINMDGVVNATDAALVHEQGPRPDARPRRADDPEPRPQPLRPVDGSADGLELGPDHHPRGQPRLGCLGDGGQRPATTPSSWSPVSRSRPRSSATSRVPRTVRTGRRSRAQVRRRRDRHDQGRRRRRQGLHPRQGRRLPARHDLGRPLRREDRQADRQAVDRPLRPQPRRHRRLVRPRQHRRHLHDPQRARRHLHPHLLGRGAELHPRPGQRDGRRTARPSSTRASWA